MLRQLIHIYSGIGGLSLGAVRAGFGLALSVDNDPILLGTHRQNFPRSGHLEADVSTLTGATLLSEAGLGEGELTGLVGGSPCQGFSRIGKRESSDRRNRLFVDTFRLVTETKPGFFLAENVPGILDSRNQTLVDEALDLVRENYTVLDPLELNAADFGAATNRERVFFFGYLEDKCEAIMEKDFIDAKLESAVTVETALSGLPKKLKETWLTDEDGWRTLRVKRTGDFWEKIYGDIPNGVGDAEATRRFAEENAVSGCISTKHKPKVRRRFEKLSQGKSDLVSRMPRLKSDGLCPTLRAGTGSDKGSYMALRPIHFSEPRVITPREAARLQGFPDWFRFHKTKWHSFRGIGNSVSPFIAEAIFRVIYSKLKTVDLKEETNGNRPKAKAHHVGA
jgi:DNA (cytosine-5)-methyltransferase 1